MKKIFAILIVLLIIVLFLIINYLFDDIDYCLDKGGRWNYQENKCEMGN